jgi:hypothetical protein
MIGITMHHVKEYEIKNDYIIKKSNLKSAEIYICIHQLRFLTHISHMDPSCLPRKVINSQATPAQRMWPPPDEDTRWLWKKWVCSKKENVEE